MRSFFDDELAHITKSLGFTRIASGAIVRSSCHADNQVKGEALPTA
jgi:lipoate synthase